MSTRRNALRSPWFLGPMLIALALLPVSLWRHKNDSWRCTACGTMKWASYRRLGPSTTVFVDLRPPKFTVRPSASATGLLSSAHAHTWQFNQGADWSWLGSGGYI